MEILGIYIYPIKSLRGISLKSTQVYRYGFEYDRCWMLVDDKWNMVTQRKLPRLSFLQPSFSEENLSIEDTISGDVLKVSIDAPKTPVKVTVWDDKVDAHVYSDAINGWFSNFLNKKVKLVKIAPNWTRQVDTDYGEIGDITTFSDGFPITILGDKSLALLNEKLVTPVSVERFRPNLLIKTNSPHEEDDFEIINIQGISLKGVKKCARCKVTTINKNGVFTKEPLKTLNSYRKENNKIYFSKNFLPLNEGILNIRHE